MLSVSDAALVVTVGWDVASDGVEYLIVVVFDWLLDVASVGPDGGRVGIFIADTVGADIGFTGTAADVGRFVAERIAVFAVEVSCIFFLKILVLKPLEMGSDLLLLVFSQPAMRAEILRLERFLLL